MFSDLPLTLPKKKYSLFFQIKLKYYKKYIYTGFDYELVSNCISKIQSKNKLWQLRNAKELFKSFIFKASLMPRRLTDIQSNHAQEHNTLAIGTISSTQMHTGLESHVRIGISSDVFDQIPKSSSHFLCSFSP